MILSALAVPVIALTACGSGSSSATSSSTESTTASGTASPTEAGTAPAPVATPTAAAKSDLAGVTVAGTDAAPKVTVAKTPFKVDKTEVKVTKEGTGPAITINDTVRTKLLLVNGTSGKNLYDDFTLKAAERWVMNNPQTLIGTRAALLGQKIGSTVVAAIPPSEAFGTVGQPQLGVGKDDTLVFLMQLQSLVPGEASGAAVAPKAGLPTVVFNKAKPATITVPKTAAPTKLEVATLVQGTGPVVAKGQTVAVTYTGVTWADGKKFDSSFDRGTAPAEFAIGTGGVIKAWDTAIVGAKVGSRLLIVAPPDQAYGDEAKTGIPAKSTLVFVVDILDAA